MMSERSYDRTIAGPGVMLISAAIFGLFGYFLAWPSINTATGNIIPLVITLKWTVRITAIVFLLAAGAAMAHRMIGEMMYSITSLLSAVAFLGIAIWDIIETDFTAGIPWFLLLVFAVWNGYHAIIGLRGTFQYKKHGE